MLIMSCKLFDIHDYTTHCKQIITCTILIYSDILHALNDNESASHLYGNCITLTREYASFHSTTFNNIITCMFSFRRGVED